jgi:SpoVK/Ycf46/Vps4 family AAA+-type ATPase
MAITREGLNFHQLQEVRRHMIEQTPGLSVVKKSVSYWDLGGLSFAKKFADLLFSHSPRPPSALIWIDELEKMFGGGEGREDGGVDRDAHRVILNAMQEYGWTGMIALGPPGSGKSEFAKATGQTYGVPTLEFDLGATRDSLVGQSEQAIRQVVKVIHGIAGAGAFFVGTANTLDHLRPELIRRFKCGIWMFDLPDRLEKDRIWEIWIGKYGLPAQDLPEDTDWSGSDIANCCWTAWMTHASLVEAAQFLTLSAQANPQAVEQLRKLAAHNKFRSASYPGPYQYVPLTSLQDTAPETRRFEL